MCGKIRYEWIEFIVFFFFKQKTAYEIKECDWSSDVCSSDLDGTANWNDVGKGAPRAEVVARECLRQTGGRHLGDRKSVV